MSTSTETPGADAPAEDESHKLQVAYRLLFERNPLPMWVYDVKTLRMLAVNEAAVAKYGYSKQEFVGLTLLDLHHEDDAAQLREHLELPAEAQRMPRLWQHRHRDGGMSEVEVVTEDLELDGIRARMAVVRDLTAQRRAEQAQRELELSLTTMLENMPDGFFSLDPAGRFTYVNSRAEELLHFHRDELVGFNVWEKFPEAAGTIFQREYERAMAEGTASSFEADYAPLRACWKVRVYPSEQGLAVYFRDVTERRVPEQRLLEERETLSAVVNATNDAIISVDVEGKIKMFNPGAERIFRRTQASMQGESIDVLLPERCREGHRQSLRQYAESRGSSRMMGLGLVKGLRADGQELDLESTISQVTVNQQQVLIANFRDVTERARVDAEFRESRTQLSELTQRLMMQEKALVKRLAQSLHDQLGQTMAAIRMAHETIMTLQAEKATTSVDRLQAQMGMLIGQAIRQVRQVLIDLRPPLLDEQGLAEALDNELRNRSLTQPQVDFSIEVAPDVARMRWPTEVEYAAFMVGREAIENALRHSGSSIVSVRLTGTPASLRLEVADNGVGIATGGTSRPGHLGIVSMHERAQAIAATVTIEPGEARGTRVIFNWQRAS
ncbi:PAS domain S-box protein [Rhodoferax sp.]|uniref:PAS domain-containing sensor histidine kinase n=1 Tax=Rhodoferax sp. TaxID=50421 RepID=UPI002726B8A1|nr:PAS domain S-box protein [Rhodoferax sp.]MDO9198759.1 PAS domain S-box protein [Rhodoferax sp.]